MFPTFVVIEKFLFLCHFKLRKLLNNFDDSKEKRHVVHSLIFKNDIKKLKKISFFCTTDNPWNFIRKSNFQIKFYANLKKGHWWSWEILATFRDCNDAMQ